MLNRTNTAHYREKIIIYVVLAAVTLAVFWQVNDYNFINFDDNIYVTENSYIQAGITLDGLLWTFHSLYAEFWHPLTWLSLMFDYQLHGLNAGGYHLTNLFLHILSTLMLFWLFYRMTGTLWKSAFVAAFFALHPLHVESVAWIAERKDVLSAFFWMLTLCLYVHYIEKPDIKGYMLVLCSFVFALMSKPVVVTLPLIMILLDYWPLKRFESQKGSLFLWQLKEKLPFFILSAVFSILTIYAQHISFIDGFPSRSRFANAPVSFVAYLVKTFWPHDMAVFYPFPSNIPMWQVIGSSLLILSITALVMLMSKRLPYLFTGWLWFAITIMPAILIQISLTAPYAMADRYHYLPSIGIAVMLAWGIPLLFAHDKARKIILFPSGIAIMAVLAVLTWHQCGYWKNSFELWNHALQVTKNNSVALDGRGNAYNMLSNYYRAVEDTTEAIRLKPDHANAYFNRGFAYAKLGQYKNAIEDFTIGLNLRQNNAHAYYIRGYAYSKIGRYRSAIADYDKAIHLKFNNTEAYINRGNAFYGLGNYQQAIENYDEVIKMRHDHAEAYYNRGNAYAKLGRYQSAMANYNEAIRLKPSYLAAYNNRGISYLNHDNNELGCYDLAKACTLGNCSLLDKAKTKGLCR